jgi:hypothetical protein
MKGRVTGCRGAKLNPEIEQGEGQRQMASQLYQVIEGLSRDKGIDPQIVVTAVEDAIALATRK